MKDKIKIISISFLSFILLFVFFLYNYYSNKNEVLAKEIKEVKVEKKEEKKKKEVKTIKVDVKGAVNNPGVYELNENSRVIDALNMAGNIKDNADTSIINLSMILKDEMVIIVYSKEEIENYKKSLENAKIITEKKKEELVCPDTINNACVNKNSKKAENKTEEKEDEIVNINTATKEELTKISGIGDGKADSIIKYREENGDFKTIDDIKNVTGIGESLYEKIKDYITV